MIGGVCALALGERDGHGGILRVRGLSGGPFGVGKQDVVVWLGGAVLQSSPPHRADRRAGRRELPLRPCCRSSARVKNSAGFDLKLAIVAGKTAGLAAAIRALQLLDDRARRQAIGRKPLRVEHDAHLPGLPADDRRFRNVVELLQ